MKPNVDLSSAKIGRNMKPSIYAFTQANLVDWIIENGEKKFRPLKFGNGSTGPVSNRSQK
jgi:hypothetical protein